jgi:hypothetical protein
MDDRISKESESLAYFKPCDVKEMVLLLNYAGEFELVFEEFIGIIAILAANEISILFKVQKSFVIFLAFLIMKVFKPR